MTAAETATWGEVPPVPRELLDAFKGFVETVERRTCENIILERAKVEAERAARDKRIDRNAIDEVAGDLVGMADLLSGAAAEAASYSQGALGLHVIERLAREMARKLEDAVDRGEAGECGT
ncbi:MAG: hypothetical protein ACREFN_10300 [Acetobacteraceae bacterium]